MWITLFDLFFIYGVAKNKINVFVRIVLIVACVMNFLELVMILISMFLRYRLYFTSNNKEKINTYSEVIEEFGTMLSEQIEGVISKKIMNEEQNKKLRRMLNRTRQLIEN